ncbi:MAG: S41 family peptidase [Prevotellaceae bacterium]|jgi:carboxyl-terminal processing protease|nr:S41 family peptidase [Prevotellaceae bacterium]
MMNKNRFFGPILVLAIVMLALYTGVRLGNVFSGARVSTPDQDNLSAVMEYISKFYVDSVNTEDMIVNILKELDPHSIYIPASELQKSNEHIEGNFEGIGVTFNMLNDTVVVLNVIPEGPSNKAGVSPGDRIVTVDDSVIAGKNIDDEKIKSLLRGKSGTKVRIEVRRIDLDEPVPIEITRGKIPLRSIDVAYMIAPGTGYIRMTGFAQTTHSEFVEAVDTLHAKGMTNIILDLRDNRGGLLEQAIKITSELFAERKLIVYTEGRAFSRENKYSKGKGKCGNDSLIVLINEHSASASEILAGAVQDNDRGTIIGRRSFGKGLVQQMIGLPDGAGLRLTIARYYIPSGRSIQRHYDHGATAYREYYGELEMRWENGEYVNADSVKLVDTTKYYTSKGRTVYGGGGVTPDVFVPVDTGSMPVSRAITSKILRNYAIVFGDRHRKELNAVANLPQMEQFFKKNNPFPEFNSYIKSCGVRDSEKEIDKSKLFLDRYLKVYISQMSPMSDLGATFLLNRFDKTVQKALEIINTQKTEDNV